MSTRTLFSVRPRRTTTPMLRHAGPRHAGSEETRGFGATAFSTQGPRSGMTSNAGIATVREEARIGNGVRIGTLCDLQPQVSIGNYARLHSNVFVARNSTIEELTWLFPCAVLVDDPHPPSDTCTRGPTVRRFAVISAAGTVSPEVEIGAGAVVR